VASSRTRTDSRAGLLLLAALFGLSCVTDAPEPPQESAVPRRVVVLAPAVAEMLDALNLIDRVVGIGDFGPWPAAIEGLPSVGGYDRPSVERVLDLGATVLLTADSRAADDLHRRLTSLGVRVLALDTSTYEGVFDSLATVGRLFECEQEAAVIATGLRDELALLRNRAEGAPRRSVLFVVGRDPFYVAGPGSHIDAMIEMVGGRNVMSDAESPYQQVSLEAALARAPEVIIDTSDNRPDAIDAVTGFWGQWEFLPAVSQGRVHAVKPGRLVIPGLRLAEMTRLMGQLVHPEIFGEEGDVAP